MAIRILNKPRVIAILSKYPAVIIGRVLLLLPLMANNISTTIYIAVKTNMDFFFQASYP